MGSDHGVGAPEFLVGFYLKEILGCLLCSLFYFDLCLNSVFPVQRLEYYRCQAT